jgi:hypothetical protein
MQQHSIASKPAPLETNRPSRGVKNWKVTDLGRSFDRVAPTRLARAYGALLGLPPPDLRSAQMGEAAQSGRAGSALEKCLLVGCV